MGESFPGLSDIPELNLLPRGKSWHCQRSSETSWQVEPEEAPAQTQLMRQGCCCEGQSCMMCLGEPPELDEPPPRGDGWHSQRSSDMGWQVEPEEAHNASGHAPGMHGLVGSPRSRAVQSPAAHIMHHEPIPPNSRHSSMLSAKLLPSPGSLHQAEFWLKSSNGTPVSAT